MMLSVDARLAYFAIVKTGSTSVQNALAGHCEISFSGHPKVTHMVPRHFDQYLRPYLNLVDLPRFDLCCQIREPASWVESWWRYRSQPGKFGPDLDASEMSFETFVGSYLDGDSRTLFQIGRPKEALTNDAGEMVVDYLYRLEDMKLFAAFLSDRFGRDISIPHHNASPRRWGRLSAPMRRRLEGHLDWEQTAWEDLTQKTASPDRSTREVNPGR